MTAILALDQGTTGSTALVVRQDGRVLGRGYREFTQYFPEPGWVEHDPDEILAGLARGDAGGAWRRRASGPAALGITNQRETVVLWDRRTLAPVARAIVWQDRRTAARCRELREAGLEPMIRRPHRPGAATPTSPRPSSSGCCVTRACAPRPSGATSRPARWRAGSWRGSPGGLHVSDHTNASRTLLYDLAARGWDDELLAPVLACPAGHAPEIVPSAGVLGRRARGAPGLPAPDRGTRRRPAVGALRAGLHAHRHGQEHLRHRRVPARPRRRCGARACARPARHGGVRPRGRAGLRPRGQRVHRRRGGPVAARRPGSHCDAPPRRGAGPERRRTPAASSSCRPSSAWARRTGRRRRAAPITGHHPRHDPGAPGARGGGVDRVRHRRPPARHDGRRAALDVRRTAGGWRRRRQRLAHAVPGRPARRAGRASRHAGDDRARRRRDWPASRPASGRRWRN